MNWNKDTDQIGKRLRQLRGEEPSGRYFIEGGRDASGHAVFREETQEEKERRYIRDLFRC